MEVNEKLLQLENLTSIKSNNTEWTVKSWSNVIQIWGPYCSEGSVVITNLLHHETNSDESLRYSVITIYQDGFKTRQASTYKEVNANSTTHIECLIEGINENLKQLNVEVDPIYNNKQFYKRLKIKT